MKRVRPASAAGKFYTNGKAELLTQLEGFVNNNIPTYNYVTRAVIVPHAGYVYSGQLASLGFQYLDKNAKNVFIIAPPHYVAVSDVSLSSFEKWITPLGEIEVNQDINEELIKRFDCKFQDEAFTNEHSVEVQIPFVQKFLPNIKIIPILANNIEKITKIIDYYWQNSENIFVISSDLSHFHHSDEAKKIDKLTAEMIETKNTAKFSHDLACGAVGVYALINFAKGKNYSLIRIGMYNSGDVTKDKSSVVGYGSWLLYKGERNNFIKKYFSDYIIDVCKKSILSLLNNETLDIDTIPPVFEESGACFVTLEKNGDLRGCMGSIIAHRTLIDDLIQNARSSAFKDPRFQPVKKDEFKDLKIDVSLLSEPAKMQFNDEADLLSQIRPNIDGIIIKDGAYQAVYLPSVWEQLPEKDLFLASLKIKAGLPPKYFSKTFEAFRFTTEYIKS